jgi:hypothetical protein
MAKAPIEMMPVRKMWLIIQKARIVPAEKMNAQDALRGDFHPHSEKPATSADKSQWFFTNQTTESAAVSITIWK